MNGLYYLAEANLYLGIFYLAYCVLLNRNTHYQLSRGYLLFSCIIAFLLPVVQIGALRPAERAVQLNAVPLSASQHLSVMKPEAPVENIKAINFNRVARPSVKPAASAPTPFVQTAPVAVKRHFTWQDGLVYAYLTGAAVLLLVLLIKLYALFRLTSSEQAVNEGKYRVIYLNGSDVAFSFFNYLFIGADASGAKTIIRHELVHIRQKHSADIILLELLKVVSWFNPFIYLLQNSLKTVHEYIADEQTAAYETDNLSYASFLLNNAYGAGGSSITHSFFNYNLLKKRIMMLNHQRSGNLAKLKYLVAIPICAALLCTSSLVFSKTYGWLDLAPAAIKLPGKHAAMNAKQKRLKITQNGIITIADKLSVGKQREKTAYTAATITKADSLLLLKNNHIKVEVVEDSIPFKTKDGRPILPVVNVDGYYLMDHFLHNNIQFNAAKGEKGGLVGVRITLDKDRRIINPMVVKSGGARLDALALNGFKAYKGIVNDDPGKSLKIGVYFFTNDYSIFMTDSLRDDPEFGGELIITSYKYSPTVTSKGYEYDESGIGFPSDNNSTRFAKVIIYDKNGDGAWYYESKCTPADLKMLKDKYGYTFPSAATSVVQFFNQKDRRHLAYIFDIASYLDAPYADEFYRYILKHAEYPRQAKQALRGGVVLLNFDLDDNGMIGNVTVARSAGNGLDEAAVTALQGYKTAIKDSPGKHSLALSFCVVENKYRPVIGDDMKKEGYVGELAICNIKAPFENARFYPAPPTNPASH